MHNPTANAPTAGYVRLQGIIGKRPTKSDPGVVPLIPVSASTWWAWVRAGRAPKPIHIGARCTVWRTSDVLAMVEASAPKAGA